VVHWLLLSVSDRGYPKFILKMQLYFVNRMYWSSYLFYSCYEFNNALKRTLIMQPNREHFLN
jgi:hypothetical protein